MPADTSGPVGSWYLDARQRWLISSAGQDFTSARWTAVITRTPSGYAGTLTDESGRVDQLDSISWNPATRLLTLRRLGPGFWEWFRGAIVAGIFVGRAAHSTTRPARPPINAFRHHLTGWNVSYLDTSLTPRVFDVVANTNYRATLRIDRDSSGLIGRWKGYDPEELEYDLEAITWDGVNVGFTRRDPAWTQVFTGTVSGRTVTGSFTQTGVPGSFPWSGTRAQVLTWGLATRSASSRHAWQQRTRAALALLMQAGQATAAATAITRLQTGVPPLPDGPVVGFNGPNSDRDDDPALWLQHYTKSEWIFTTTVPDPYGGPPVRRHSHAWLTVPTDPPPPGRKYRAVVAVNGHPGVKGWSSAWAMLDPTDGDYWYGEAFARRGNVVLAVDISHRPIPDRADLYNDPGACDPTGANGADPTPNGNHPAISFTEFPHDSDWEEDGERAFDASRALDILLTGRLGVDVDPSRVVITGLSMGGEVTTVAAAMDPRFAMAIPAGFSPDLNVMRYHGNHACFEWRRAFVGEYLDTSDLHALIAPRPLLMQTGSADGTFSSYSPPFTSDKQVARRSRAAYGTDTGNFVHYLQPWGANPNEPAHQYRCGDVRSDQPHGARSGVHVPAVTGPASPGSLTWQTDGTTVVPSLGSQALPTVFDYLDYHLP